MLLHAASHTRLRVAGPQDWHRGIAADSTAGALRPLVLAPLQVLPPLASVREEHPLTNCIPMQLVQTAR